MALSVLEGRRKDEKKGRREGKQRRKEDRQTRTNMKAEKEEGEIRKGGEGRQRKDKKGSVAWMG